MLSHQRLALHSGQHPIGGCLAQMRATLYALWFEPEKYRECRHSIDLMELIGAEEKAITRRVHFRWSSDNSPRLQPGASQFIRQPIGSRP